MKRHYSLFEKKNGRWMRVSNFAYYKPQAVRVFQTSLLNAVFFGIEQSLRVVPENEINLV